jgi:hypothetical protein
MKKIKRPSMRRQLLMIAGGLLYAFILGLVIFWLKLGTIGIIALMCASSLLFSIYAAIFNKQRFSLKKYAVGCAWIIGIVYFIQFCYKFTGKWSFLITTLVLAGFIMYRNRVKFFETKYTIESMLFGKPLYKYRQLGKRPPSIQVVLKK